MSWPLEPKVLALPIVTLCDQEQLAQLPWASDLFSVTRRRVDKVVLGTEIIWYSSLGPHSKQFSSSHSFRR